MEKKIVEFIREIGQVVRDTGISVFASGIVTWLTQQPAHYVVQLILFGFANIIIGGRLLKYKRR